MLKTLLSFVLVLLFLVAGASAQTISVNFAGERTPVGVMGAPGYVADNWLNTANQASSWGIVYDLEDETGSLTGATMTMWASQFGAMQTFVTDQFSTDTQMMECGIGGWDVNAASFTVEDIPYPRYTVVVYFCSADDFDYVQKINVNSEPAIYAKYTRHALNGYVEAVSTEDLEPNTVAGNYAVFKGLNSSTLDVSVDPGWYSTSHPRAYISGFQIIPTAVLEGVSVNFPGERTPTGVMGAPGYKMDNWLNTINQPSSWGTTYDLENADNEPIGATLSVWASQFGAMATFVTDEFSTDTQMMECGIGGWDTNAASFTVTGIPYVDYDVVVYFASANSFDYVQKINVNGESLFAKNVRHATDGYVQATATEDLEAATEAGNYAVFYGLNDSTLNVSVDPGWYSASDPRAYISGFQIITIRYLCADNAPSLGDINGDCVINLGDFAIMAANWLVDASL